MDETIIKYIKDQIAKGKTISQIISIMQEHHYTEAQINTYIQKALNTQQEMQSPPPPPPPSIETNLQPSPSQTMPAPADNNNSAPKHFDLTKAFVIIGAILIIAAVVIVIYSQWSAANPLVKILFMMIPMILLYGLSYYLNKNERYKEISDITLGLGSFILPVGIGTIICQAKIITEVNALVIFLSAILALPIYLILEYMYKKFFMSAFTIIAIFVAYFALIAQYNANMDITLWLAFVLSIIILGLGFFLTKMKIERTTFYLILGTLASLFFLPVAMLYSLNKDNSLSDETNIIIISLFGILYMCVASGYYYLHKRFENNTFYSLKRLIEELSPFIILLPYVFLVFDEIGFSILALCISVAFVLASTRVIINTLLYLGSLGIIITIITISSKIFTDSIGWPIILFIAGFAAISIGLMIKKIYQERKSQGIPTVLLGLGIDPQVVLSLGPKQKMSPKTIVAIILLILFGPILLVWLFSAFRGSVMDSGKVNIPNSKTENYKSISKDEIIPEASVTPDINKSNADNLSITGEISVYQFNSNYNTDPKTITNYVDSNRIVIHGPNDSMIDAIIDENTKFFVNNTELNRDQVYYDVTYKNAILSYYSDGQYNVAKTISFY